LFDNLQDVPDLEARLVRLAVAEMRVGATAAERAALAIDRAIRQVKKADWRGNRFKEREVRNAVQSVLGDDQALVDTVFEILQNQRAY
jgi:type I restriction enzyme R subunit